jgi:threonylcarbamoyladenosine tRNA methylthiotransferase MtaB
MMTTFSVLTLGCKVNSYESEALITNLCNHGYQLRTTDDICDVYIINTCTVTSTSDQKSRQMIHRLKRKNPNAIVVAMGCYVQLHPKEASELADIVVGTSHRMDVYHYIESFLTSRKEIDAVTNSLENHEYEELEVSRLTQTTRGFVKIQDGCENFCSYCAIPYARGPIKSRKPEYILEEVNKLVSEDVKEIIIAGINTGCYGKDLGNINLAMLLQMLLDKTSIARIRLSSIELMEITDELLDVVENSKGRIANHFHIPLQAGCDSVLIRMNRKYLTNDYRNRLNEIRNRFENVAITTDCLAGFVGETEEEFKQACDFISEMKFSSMHIFPYSRRKGTKADAMEGHLDPKVIQERTHVFLNLASKMKEEYEV